MRSFHPELEVPGLRGFASLNLAPTSRPSSCLKENGSSQSLSEPTHRPLGYGTLQMHPALLFSNRAFGCFFFLCFFFFLHPLVFLESVGNVT